MGLVTLVIGLILFIGAHVSITLRPQRAAIVKAIGLVPYKILMSVVSLAGLYFVFRGFGMYRDSGLIPVWSPPGFMRHVTEALMLPACVFLAAAFLPGNIKAAVKHPLLVAVKTWAFAHLLTNGDVGGIILFGSLLAWAVYDRITLKHRSDPAAPLIPLGGYRNDIAAVIVGIILFLALGMVFHPLVVGVIVFGTPAFGT
jgi:uncharacterized membrane protein